MYLWSFSVLHQTMIFAKHELRVWTEPQNNLNLNQCLYFRAALDILVQNKPVVS